MWRWQCFSEFFDNLKTDIIKIHEIKKEWKYLKNLEYNQTLYIARAMQRLYTQAYHIVYVGKVL